MMSPQLKLEFGTAFFRTRVTQHAGVSLFKLDTMCAAPAEKTLLSVINRSVKMAGLVGCTGKHS